MDHNPAIDPHLAYLFPFIFLFAIAAVIVLIIPFWVIFKKSGQSPWLSLLIVIPFGAIIVPYLAAFLQWKVVPVNPVGAPIYPPRPNYPVPPAEPYNRG